MGEVEGGEASGLDGVHEVVATPAPSAALASATGPLRGILTEILGSLTITDEPEVREECRSDATPEGRKALTDEERAVRIARSMEHHFAYGLRVEDDDQRMRAFLNDTACIPLEIFHAALRVSRQTHAGNFPPTAGQVIHTARSIEWEREPLQYHVDQGGIPDPRWYQRMKAGKPPQFLTVAPGDVIKEIA